MKSMQLHIPVYCFLTIHFPQTFAVTFAQKLL